MKSKRAAFTLVELIVVIAIVAMLMALLLPALRSARAQARQIICMNQLRSSAIAMNYYANDFKGVIAKTDFGRSDVNTSWQGYTYHIANSRAAPNEKKTVLFGAWLINGYLANGAGFICPDMAILEEGSEALKLSDRKQAITVDFAATFRSGGKEPKAAGSPYPWATVLTTSYTIQGVLIPIDKDFGGTGDVFRRHMLANASYPHHGRRIQAFTATWPVMADYRGTHANDVPTTTNHDSRGYNVMRGDGGVVFVNVPQLVRGATAPGIINTTHIASNTRGTLPLDPRDDDAAWDHNFAGKTRNLNQAFEFWNAMHGALQSH